MTLFWILAIALVVSAVFTITAKQPVHSVVGLLTNFAALSVLYLSLSAEFIAVVQILVYSGAILILFVFVIALLSSGVKPFDVGPNRLPRIALPAVIMALIGFGVIAWGVLHASPLAIANVTGPVGVAEIFGSIADFGRALFGRYLLPFEMTALVLMVAVIGVVMLAGEKVETR
jgi:NADH-quinone oxidoreductase subunit J